MKRTFIIMGHFTEQLKLGTTSVKFQKQEPAAVFDSKSEAQTFIKQNTKNHPMGGRLCNTAGALNKYFSATILEVTQ